MNQIFTKQEKIKFKHVDYAGIVFYPRFLEMLNDLVEAARLGEILTKKLWVKNLGGASILCGFKFEDKEGKTCLEGEVTLVNVAFTADRNNIKAEGFNEEMKGKILQYIQS